MRWGFCGFCLRAVTQRFFDLGAGSFFWSRTGTSGYKRRGDMPNVYPPQRDRRDMPPPPSLIKPVVSGMFLADEKCTF